MTADAAATTGPVTADTLPPGTVGQDTGTAERELAARMVDTLLREDYGGLSSRLRTALDEPVLELPAGDGTALLLPLERDGFLADFRVRRPSTGWSEASAGQGGGQRRGQGPGAGTGRDRPLSLDDVHVALAVVSDPLDRAGVLAFTEESRHALAALRLRERHLPDVRARLARLWQAMPNPPGGPDIPGRPDSQAAPGTGGRQDPPAGARGLLAYEALAAAMPHPAYPTSEARPGFSADDALRYAPEYLPQFELHWVAVPRAAVTVAGPRDRPPGWPNAADVGLPASIDASHELLPVHPLTARTALAGALTDIGDPGAALVAPGTWLRVTPTLSIRTVAVTERPDQHVKLPLPTSTLGLLNRRLIQPGTLADGALVRSLLAVAVDQDPVLRAGLLLADEASYVHAGHPCLGYLLRRLPPGLWRSRIVPVAALLAPSPRGPGRPLVIEELAGVANGGDLLGLFGDYLEVLFGVHVRLFARYGIALEAHQQNAALVLGPPAGKAAAPSGPKLLVKDFDGTLIQLPRLTAALGTRTPEASAVADHRLITQSDDALADVFITITVHLCAGALAFGLARRGVAPLPDLLGLVKRKLATALDAHAGWPAASLLRARALDAGRLPGKSMVTAGTLVAKARTGASDINKFYGTTGPNYLRSIGTSASDQTDGNTNDRSCE